MVVEDEGIVAKSIYAMLKSLGYAVAAGASSGEEAIKKTAETHPDLVLMDIVLEGDIDGVEAAEQIRARFDIPVVYLTAHADENTLKRAKITEPYGYILKPFSERELHAAVETALYKYMMERKLAPSTENAELGLALKELVAMEGITASAVVTRDGIIVESLGKYDLSASSALSPVVAMMTRAAERCTRMLKKGEMIEMITKADNGVILTEKCEEFIFLVAVDKGFDFESRKPQREKVKAAIRGMV